MKLLENTDTLGQALVDILRAGIIIQKKVILLWSSD